ncbi:MAG: circadian clock KaiB family protein [Litorilinea sp.]
MTSKRTANPEARRPATDMILRLYVAGNSPNSERARVQLHHICEVYLRDHYQVEYVDVWEHPEVAFADRVFATPALRSVAPEPSVLIFGDLTQTEEVLYALGIEARSA